MCECNTTVKEFLFIYFFQVVSSPNTSGATPSINTEEIDIKTGSNVDLETQIGWNLPQSHLQPFDLTYPLPLDGKLDLYYC